MIAYKFLRAGAVSPFAGASWPDPGRWLESEGPLDACTNGIHAAPRGALAYWLDRELWEVELDGEIVDEGTVLLARRARLVTRVADWPRSSAAFARACAERARSLAERAPRDARLREVAADAEAWARSGTFEEEVLAVYAGAVAADLVEPGAFDAERAWQSAELAGLLGLDVTNP